MGSQGCGVDERYGRTVIDAAHIDGMILSVPVERSGRELFELEFGDDWLEHLHGSRPDYAKILVRDNPSFPSAQRRDQLQRLRTLSEALRTTGRPLLYELLVPATDVQRRAAGDSTDSYDLDVRPGLVERVIADNHDAGVEPALWKVEGFETADAVRSTVARARAGGRDDVGVIILGRDAPPERLTHWLGVAAPVEGVVGFAIGRSIWETPIAEHQRGQLDDAGAVAAIAHEYLRYAGVYAAAIPTPGVQARDN